MSFQGKSILARNRIVFAWSVVAVALAAVAFTAPANAGLIGQLGILDLDANGGINPATGQPWKYDDAYHLIYVTTTTTDALSTDIADYNAFVQADANAQGMGGVDWFALGSTTSIHARDNAVITGPVINVFNNAAVATDEADLWNFLFPTSVLDLSGSPKNVWTGTQAGGVAHGGNQLGATNGTARMAWSAWSNWGAAWRAEPTSGLLPMVAISQELTVIPEPSSAMLVLLGLVGLLMVRRKRSLLP